MYRDYTRPDLPSGNEGELGGGTNVPDLSAALAGEHNMISKLIFFVLDASVFSTKHMVSACTCSMYLTAVNSYLQEFLLHCYKLQV